jgi:hypothetical protein
MEYTETKSEEAFKFDNTLAGKKYFRSKDQLYRSSNLKRAITEIKKYANKRHYDTAIPTNILSDYSRFVESKLSNSVNSDIESNVKVVDGVHILEIDGPIEVMSLLKASLIEFLMTAGAYFGAKIIMTRLTGVKANTLSGNYTIHNYQQYAKTRQAHGSLASINNMVQGLAAIIGGGISTGVHNRKVDLKDQRNKRQVLLFILLVDTKKSTIVSKRICTIRYNLNSQKGYESSPAYSLEVSEDALQSMYDTIARGSKASGMGDAEFENYKAKFELLKKKNTGWKPKPPPSGGFHGSSSGGGSYSGGSARPSKFAQFMTKHGRKVKIGAAIGAAVGVGAYAHKKYKDAQKYNYKYAATNGAHAKESYCDIDDIFNDILEN